MNAQKDTTASVFTGIYGAGIIPVAVIEREEDAVPVAKALADGGISAIEVTFRTAAAKESIRRIRDAFGEKMLIGAGTVLNEAQADEAVLSGADFIVSPGFSENVVKHCLEQQIPVIPGISGPTEAEAAMRLGITTVKFFPAEPAGGLAMLKAMSAPYPDLRFMPTGGIHEKNLADYLAFPKVIACGGSFMLKSEWLKAGAFDKITEAARNAVILAHGFRIEHVGINAGTAAATEAAAASFAPFPFAVNRTGSGLFLNHDIEILAQPSYGKVGHICIETNDIRRAEAYLSARGVHFIEESKVKRPDGSYPAVYLDLDVCGFAVHLFQK